MKFHPISSADEKSKIYVAAMVMLVVAYFAFPVAMGLAYAAMVFAFLLGLASWKIIRPNSELLKSPLVLASVGLYLLIAIGWMYSSASWDDAKLHFSKYAKLILIPVFFLLLQNFRWRKSCVAAFMGSMAFILLSVYANVFCQLPWSKTQNLGWGQDHTVIGDYITQNIMMAFFTVLVLEKAVSVQSRGYQLFLGAVALAAVVAVTQLSNGRTGYVLLLVVLGMYALMWARGAKQWLAIGAIACAVAASLATSDKVHQRLEEAITEARNSDAMEITSIGGRINFWKNTLEMTLEKPITGWGTGEYHAQWCVHVTKEGWCEFGRWHPHNQYLFFWMEHGILGLALFIVLVLSPIWMTRQMPASSRRMAWCFSALFAVNSLINAPLWSSRESHFFVLMLCLVCAGISFQREHDKDMLQRA